MNTSFPIDTKFNLISTCLGNGKPIPQNWIPVSNLPMFILVGGMGVGKTTTVDSLINQGHPIHLLPNRRELTIDLIVSPQQRAEGKPARNLPRLERIPYIKRYQNRYPGGLAHAISHLSVASPCQGTLIFDGLRGASEINFAVNHLPLAYFIMLITPDIVRVQRLLERRDPYDKLGFKPPEVETLKELRDFVSLGVPDARRIFTPQEEQMLLDLVRNGEVEIADLADKLSLIWAERSLYDLEETLETVNTLAKHRSLVIDTTNYQPEIVLEKVLQFMDEFTTKEKYSNFFSFPNQRDYGRHNS